MSINGFYKKSFGNAYFSTLPYEVSHILYKFSHKKSLLNEKRAEKASDIFRT
jgi:hypothetical protein